MTRSSYSNQPAFHFHSAGNSASRMDLALGPPSAPSQPSNTIFPPFENSQKSVNIGDWVARKKPLEPKRKKLPLPERNNLLRELNDLTSSSPFFFFLSS